MIKICISVSSQALDPSPCHKLSHLLEPPPLERDVLYGRPLRHTMPTIALSIQTIQSLVCSAFCKKIFVGTNKIFSGTNTREIYEMTLFLGINTEISNIL